MLKKHFDISRLQTLRITDADVVNRVKIAVKLDIVKKNAMNLPIAVYDSKTQIIYAQYSDGTSVEIGTRVRKGWFSEHVKNQT